MNDYKVFKDVNDIENFGNFQIIDSSLSDEEKQELNSYTGSWYRVMNRHLLVDEEDEELDKEIRIFDEALSKCSISENIVAYRGSSKVWKDLMIDKYNIPRKPYWSTSLLKKTAIDYALSEQHGYFIKIYIKKGTCGLYVPSVINDDLEENEVVLPRTTKFKLKRKGLFERYIEVETLPAAQ